MSRRNPKPTPSNIRNRLFRIEADATSGAELARRWDPKGRYFRARRDLVVKLEEIAQLAMLLRHSITR